MSVSIALQESPSLDNVQVVKSPPALQGEPLDEVWICFAFSLSNCNWMDFLLFFVSCNKTKDLFKSDIVTFSYFTYSTNLCKLI